MFCRYEFKGVIIWSWRGLYKDCSPTCREDRTRRGASCGEGQVSSLTCGA